MGSLATVASGMPPAYGRSLLLPGSASESDSSAALDMRRSRGRFGAMAGWAGTRPAGEAGARQRARPTYHTSFVNKCTKSVPATLDYRLTLGITSVPGEDAPRTPARSRAARRPRE